MSIEQDRLRIAEIREEQKKLLVELLPILDRLAQAGEYDHAHGDGTYESPMVWHSHPFTDPTDGHDHTPDQLDELTRLRHDAEMRMP